MSYVVVRTETGVNPPDVTYMKVRDDNSGIADWVADINQASRQATRTSAANAARLLDSDFASPKNTFTVQEISDVYTYATLPRPSPGLKGVKLFISNGKGPQSVGDVPKDGGTLMMPVYCDGAQWLIGG